jgi:hypothetical protein
VIIDEREQVGLAASDDGAVERVAGPPVVACRGLEPAKRGGRRAVGTGIQAVTGEEALHGPLRDHSLFGGSDDRCDLRSCSAWDLAF